MRGHIKAYLSPGWCRGTCGERRLKQRIYPVLSDHKQDFVFIVKNGTDVPRKLDKL